MPIDRTTICPDCGLRGNTVPPYLEKEPAEGQMRIAIIGEAPGEVEELQKRPFTGPSGKLIYGVLGGHGYDASTILFTNVLCHRPPDNRTPTLEEIEKARPRLLRELRDYKPNRVLVLGGTAATALLGVAKGAGKQGQKITQIRGLWQKSEYLPGVDIMPTLHPAAVLRAPSSFDEFQRDVEFLRGSTEPFPTPNIIEVNNLADCEFCIRNFLAPYSFPQDKLVRSIDIESEGFDPRTRGLISIAISPSIYNSVVFTQDALKQIEVLQELNTLFSYPDLIWIGHNAINFDECFLNHGARVRQGQTRTELHLDGGLTEPFKFSLPVKFDTMLMHYAVDERTNTHSLKVISSNLFGVKDYEAEVQKFLDKEWGYRYCPRDILYKYQAYDTCLTYALFEYLRPKLDEGKLLSLHNDVFAPAARMLGEIKRYGVLLNRKWLSDLSERWGTEIQDLNAKMIKIAESYNFVQVYRSKKAGTKTKAFNPGSTYHVGYLLYDLMGLPQVSLKAVASSSGDHKDTLDSTADDVLNAIEHADKSGFIKTLKQARRLKILKSTFVDGLIERMDDKDQIYPDMLIHGTETGRLASRNPNIQNIPKHDYEDRKKKGLIPYADEIRYAFIPRPGYKFVDIDYSQLEYRVCAWYCEDPGLIAAFNSGEDFHRAVAATVYNVPVDKVTKNQRHSAKFVNFGIMYGRQAPALARSELMWAYSDTIPCTIQQAEKFLREFLDRFPKQEEFMTRIEKQVLEDGYVESWYGRRRRFPFIPNHQLKAKFQREARNMPIQGMASDIALLAAVEIHNTFDPEEVKVLFLVHDAIVMEVRDDLVEEYLPKLTYIMEHPNLEDKGFPFAVEAEVMDRWAMREED